MKKTTKITTTFVLLAALLVVVSSCERRVSLAELRQMERESIENYITDNGIEILTEMPADSIFAENQYLRLPSGLHIRIIERGVGRTPEAGDRMQFRYYTFNMRGDTIMRAMSPAELLNPVLFLFQGAGNNYLGSASGRNVTVLNGLRIAEGIQEAIGLLGFDGAAYLVVPSVIGSGHAQQHILAFRYELRHVRITP